MKMTEKLTAAALAVLIIAGAAPVTGNFRILPDMAITASAAEVIDSGSCGENLIWQLTENGTNTYKLTISGTGDMDHFNTSNFVPWKSYKTKITDVEIGNNVTSIEDYAFWYCTKLTSVTIPNKVKTIGESSFYGCTKLTSVNIPNSVTSIGWGAFHSCTSLESITLPSSVASIGNNAFGYCTSLNSITFLGTESEWNILKDNSSDIGLSDVTVYFAEGFYCGDSSVNGGKNVFYALADTDSDGTNDTLTIIGTGAMADYSQGNSPWYS